MLIFKKPIPVRAFALGEHTSAEQELLDRGLLSEDVAGLWRLKTREAMEEGELVHSGDYVKLDSTNMPYPVRKDWFEANHNPLGDGWYLQNSAPRKAWSVREPKCDELCFILENGQLTWKDGTFSAFLWGTLQTADDDAVIVFDRIRRGESDALTEVEFHFVAADEFDKTYDILPE